MARIVETETRKFLTFLATDTWEPPVMSLVPCLSLLFLPDTANRVADWRRYYTITSLVMCLRHAPLYFFFGALEVVLMRIYI